MKHTKLFLFTLAAMLMGVMASCDDSESYSDLLRDEERATNWFLAQQRVETSVPADSVFEIGADAPFYRMDEDGYIYMQVIDAGDPDMRPETGDKVYFRYNRKNLKLMYEGADPAWSGNMDNLTAAGFTAFFKGNTLYPSSTQFGTGIQLPMDYLGYFAEVNLVLRSYEGFLEDQSQCIPYIINVKYYKGEY
ncbi:MAG: DUF4827 domain-containing protein [Bacteroides sp.]|nr:DUF4827 domain-containing protein [Bacteroides sp.]